MKKTSKLAILLSLILGASMVLPACGSGDTGASENSSSGGKGPSTPEQTVEELEAEANKGYKTRIAEWLKYVEYDAPETESPLTWNAINKKSTDEDAYFNVDAGGYSYGFFTTYTVTQETKEFPVEEETEGGAEEGAGAATEGAGAGDGAGETEPETVEKTVSETTITTVYSAETGKEIKSFTSKQVVMNGEIVDVENYTPADQYLNLVDELFVEGIFEVFTVKYELMDVPEDEKDTYDEDEYKKDVDNYETVETYSYYDKTGKAIATDLEEQGTVNGEFMTLGDKTYVVRDGEIIKTFNAGEEYNLPKFNKDSQIELINIGSMTDPIVSAQGYAYYEQGDYGYCIREAAPQLTKFGDFYLTLFPSVQIEIVKDYDVVLDYVSDAYAIMSYTVLSNGNVYICEYRQLNAGATEYDVISGEMKFDIVHVVLDVATGTINTVDKDFVAQKLYTNATPEMKTLNCQVTMGDVVGGCKVKDGYALAQIQKMANGSISGEVVYAVLDAELNIVAELPAIIANQFGYVGFLTEDKMLLNTNAIGEYEEDSHSIYYVADVTTGDLELYLSQYEQIGVEYIDNGFIYEDVVYDYQWNELKDLSDDDYEYYVIDGKLLIQEDDERPYFGKIVVDNDNDDYDDDDEKWGASQTKQVSYEFYTFDFITDGTSNDSYYMIVEDGYIMVEIDTWSSSASDYVGLYNFAGTKLWYSAKTTTTSWYYDEEDSSKRVKYTKRIDVFIDTLSDGVHLVEVWETWTALDYYNYETKPADKNFIKYYVMK